jgi:hypothetical protein
MSFIMDLSVSILTLSAFELDLERCLLLPFLRVDEPTLEALEEEEERAAFRDFLGLRLLLPEPDERERDLVLLPLGERVRDRVLLRRGERDLVRLRFLAERLGERERVVDRFLFDFLLPPGEREGEMW